MIIHGGLVKNNKLEHEILVILITRINIIKMIDNLLCVELSSVCFRGWVVALVATPPKTP